MASRPQGFGMTRELNEKKAAKYDSTLEAEARAWIDEALQESCLGAAVDQNDFHEKLKNGVILCRLVNIIQPGSVKRINESKMAFKMMENIGNFLSACEAIGVNRADMFQTVDLYEAQNLPQVINGIHALGRKAHKKNSKVPPLGPRESTENRRDFSEEQLQEGKNVIGLQMGTNKGASQSGMTPYGQGRAVDGQR